MTLIATVGANKISHKHKYLIDEKVYESELSFLAIAQAYKIENIILIGTEKSEDSIKTILDKNPNIKMVTIESSSVEEVFQESLKYISKDTILDLTQGYRHYPMLTLLASVFLQSDSSKHIKDIFYAQIIDENCRFYETTCEYHFLSLIKYLDIANMARIINTFTKTLLTLDYEINNKEFNQIKKGLMEITQELFSNNYFKSKEKAFEVNQIIDKIIKKSTLETMQEHLKILQKELETIQNLISNKESKTLLNVSKYLKDKGILLHSITALYEAMVAFLDEKVNNNRCDDTNIYKRRNCLKINMGNCNYYQYKINIPKCRDFSNLLKKVDELRNISAHAHTTGSYEEDLKKEIDKAIKFLLPIMR